MPRVKLHLRRYLQSRLKICGLAAIGLLLGVGCAAAQDKTFELKLAHWVPPSHPLQKALEEWGYSVQQDSGGTIKYKIYPAQQLGKAFDHYDMTRDGIADLDVVRVFERDRARGAAAAGWHHRRVRARGRCTGESRGLLGRRARTRRRPMAAAASRDRHRGEGRVPHRHRGSKNPSTTSSASS